MKRAESLFRETCGKERSHRDIWEREESFGREETGGKEESLQERGVTTGEKEVK